MRGIDLPHKAYVNICGTDIVRDEKGTFLVLEDNARTPSGVSYVVENRHMMLRAFPDLLDDISLRPIDNYGARLIAALQEMAPAGIADPQVVLLSPGTYNSAYFEHVFLAREMGVPLVEGPDLVVEDERVWMRTTGGLARVDVIYRRINDDYLDPEAFIPDSMLGVPGLMRAYRAGTVALANAIGTGVADDKAVYAYMPRIIRYYLGEDPILPMSRPISAASRKPCATRSTILAELVVKPVGEAGGYGITVGPKASRAELDECRAKLVADPANYISQPCINLSVAPTLVDGAHRAAPCRSAAVCGDRIEHLGLARRIDAGGAAPRLAGRQFLAGRRLEGYLGPWLTFCSPATRIASSGSRAMSSAPRTSRASSTSTRPSRATAAAARTGARSSS